MIEIIAFDADDTLWHNETLYLRAQARFKQLLSDYHNPERIQQRLDEIEMRNIRYFGYGIKSFTLSMIETALELTDGSITGKEIQKILDIAKQMLTAEVDLFEQAEDTLDQLSSKYELMLITKGDSFEQERKVAGSGLTRYFKYIEIVANKTAEIYRGLLAKYSIDPTRFLMVGNSIKSDILPVIEIGGQAVYIPYTQTWVYETVSDPGARKSEYIELEYLGQLPVFLESYNH
jgi:putative hydrolase of the HAD superfamily